MKRKKSQLIFITFVTRLVWLFYDYYLYIFLFPIITRSLTQVTADNSLSLYLYSTLFFFFLILALFIFFFTLKLLSQMLLFFFFCTFFFKKKIIHDLFYYYFFSSFPYYYFFINELMCIIYIFIIVDSELHMNVIYERRQILIIKCIFFPFIYKLEYIIMYCCCCP